MLACYNEVDGANSLANGVVSASVTPGQCFKGIQRCKQTRVARFLDALHYRTVLMAK